MAALHKALEILSPTPFSSVPSSESEATTYLQTAFQKAQTILDSIPLPPPTDPLVAGRLRSSTSASVASNVSEISSSSARSEPLDPSNVGLQKEWGKPIKLNAKDNPLGMAVYKCAGKDGNGAWFARRSVHEGLGFKKWKLGLQREFPESLEVQGGPGEGNIRGIGGERRVERLAVDGVGSAEVYHLSAQFPGPTTPRDFVTLLLTSSSALSESAGEQHSPPSSEVTESPPRKFSDTPRHFMVISRPCIHPDCPPRDGFIRGRYESVEFIREIPKKSKKISSSMIDLPKSAHTRGESLEKEAVLRAASQGIDGETQKSSNEETSSGAAAEDVAREGRKRGNTISFAQTRGASAKGEAIDNPNTDDEDETNPVEWIMITRSDPGGSVPRFMVERGTPGGIVSDASKFLDWACKKEHPDDEAEALEKGDTEHIKEKKRKELEAYETNGHLAGLIGTPDDPAPAVVPTAALEAAKAETKVLPQPEQNQQQGGLFSSVAGAAYAGLETYAPQAVIDRLPRHQPSPSMASNATGQSSEIPLPVDGNSNDDKEADTTPLSPTVSSTSSIMSFASAEDHFDGEDEIQSTESTTPNSKSPSSKNTSSLSPHEKQLAKLHDRKRQVNEKLAKAREKQPKDKKDLTSKEEAAIRKAEEKHQKELQKHEEKYKKEIAKLDAKRQKEAAKLAEQKKKTEDKDEKGRLTREKGELRQELEVVRQERDILQQQVGALQRENTSLVVRLGKIDEGKDLLKEVKLEIEGKRSRSSSLRRGNGTPETGKEATVLGGEKKEAMEALK